VSVYKYGRGYVLDIFILKIHQNNIFFIFKILFLTQTHQNNLNILKNNFQTNLLFYDSHKIMLESMDEDVVKKKILLVIKSLYSS